MTAVRPPGSDRTALRITVVGSINLDLVVRCERLPRPGETVSDASFVRIPGGKGANQAVACARLGAEVTMIGAVGADPFAEEALAGLREAGVALELLRVEEQTGVALVLVDADGETEIAVVPGANRTLGDVELPEHDAVLCQLEVPDDAVLSAWEGCRGLFCLNAAPARPVRVDPDVTIVNRYELEALSRRDGLVAVTLGAEGAMLLDDGEEIARAAPPQVDVVDGTAAGDAFTACLVVSLLEERELPDALERACAAGALAASRPGAQPSLPTRAEIEALLGPE
ncbi:MAG TPA: ribokinase [Gaiellaceae bacterium]|nr:ribokinase [Gaiellaceae bacterium]